MRVTITLPFTRSRCFLPTPPRDLASSLSPLFYHPYPSIVPFTPHLPRRAPIHPHRPPILLAHFPPLSTVPVTFLLTIIPTHCHLSPVPYHPSPINSLLHAICPSHHRSTTAHDPLLEEDKQPNADSHNHNVILLFNLPFQPRHQRTYKLPLRCKAHIYKYYSRGSR